jgi:hypothetical protein
VSLPLRNEITQNVLKVQEFLEKYGKEEEENIKA